MANVNLPGKLNGKIVRLCEGLFYKPAPVLLNGTDPPALVIYIKGPGPKQRACYGELLVATEVITE